MTQPKTLGYCLALLLALTMATAETVYKAVGDNVVLTPEPVADGITSITWKHGPDLCMQWEGDEIYTYRHFEARGELNKMTAAMTINGLTLNDTGSYTAEINGKVTYGARLQVISPVSKPSISKRCDPDMNYCLLTCEGSTPDAEPINFLWTIDDKSVSSNNVYNMTKEMKEQHFRCILKNPVSSETSDPLPDPLTTSNLNWLFVLIPVGVLVVVGLLLYFKCKGKADKWTPQGGANKQTEEGKADKWTPQGGANKRTEEGRANKRTEEGQADKWTPQEMETMLPNGQAQPAPQGQAADGSPENNVIMVSEVQEASTSPVTPNTSNHIEDHEDAAASDTSRDTEGPSGISETANNSTCIVQVHEPPPTTEALNPESPEDKQAANGQLSTFYSVVSGV